ncbi:MAG: hypothetical protein AMXMBFR7_10150 [Planctomycetota bacterium]
MSPAPQSPPPEDDDLQLVPSAPSAHGPAGGPQAPSGPQAAQPYAAAPQPQGAPVGGPPPLAPDPEAASGLGAFKKAKREDDEERPVHFWILGGLIGGAIGSAVWLAIALPTGWTLGIFVIVMGALVGAGVRMGAKGAYGVLPGAVAALLTLGFSYICLHTIVKHEMASWSGEDNTPDETIMISDIAGEVELEVMAQGRQTEVPDENYENDDLKDNYQPSIWAEAEKRWNALPPEERTKRIERHHKDKDEAMSTVADVGVLVTLITSPMFIVMIVLAAITAYKNGAGGT